MRSRLRAAVTLASALLCACAPEPFDCERSTTAPALDLSVGVTGFDHRVTLVAPLGTCVSDALRVTAEVFDPENRAVVTTVESLARTREGFVTATLLFRPRLPGTYLVRAAFEPTLGVAQALVPVAEDLSSSGVEVTLPEGAIACAGGPWPVDDTTIACERRDAGRIEVRTAAGASASFEGRHLVVAGRTLWSLTAAGVLQRRVVDAGVPGPVSAEAAGFLLVDTAGLHGEDLALRWRDDRVLGVARGTSALTVTASGVPFTAPPAVAAATLTGGVYFWSAPQHLCLNESCGPLERLLGVEPTVAWQQPGPLPLALGAGATPAWPATLRPAPVRLPETGFARWPVWLDPARVSGARSVFVATDGPGVRLVALPPDVTARVGSAHLVFPVSASTLRLVRWREEGN